MSEFRTCDGLRACGRRIPAETFNTPSAHAPGCSRRLSMLAKANAAKRRAKADRAAERAAAREALQIAARWARHLIDEHHLDPAVVAEHDTEALALELHSGLHLAGGPS